MEGLDIINTLSEHYNFSVPIFADNAEAEECLHEYQRTLNDLKYLKFKKLDQERKIANGI